MKTLLVKALTAQAAAQNDMAQQLEFIQLQNQLQDKKLTIMAAKMGITFNELDQEPSQVPHNDDPSSPK